MKKKNVKSLKLNKKSVSNLTSEKLNGGLDTGTVKLCVPSDDCDTVYFTCGNCIQTFGDPGCITGIPFICIQR